MDESVFAFAKLAIYLTILIFTIYGVILGYHWFKYGADQKKSTVAMAIYIVGSVISVLGLVTSFNFL